MRSWVTAPAMQLNFQSLVPNLSKIHSVLDVGVGTAIFPQLLGILDTQLVGIDVSVDMLAIAKKRFSQHCLFQASGEAIPFRRNCFDLVYLRNVIKHIGDPRHLASEMLRVTLPKGYILVVESFAPSEMYRSVVKGMSQLVEPEQKELMRLSELRELFNLDTSLVAERVFTVERSFISDHLAVLGADAELQRMSIDLMIHSPDEFKREINLSMENGEIKFLSFWTMLLFSKS